MKFWLWCLDKPQIICQNHNNCKTAMIALKVYAMAHNSFMFIIYICKTVSFFDDFIFQGSNLYILKQLFSDIWSLFWWSYLGSRFVGFLFLESWSPFLATLKISILRHTNVSELNDFGANPLTLIHAKYLMLSNWYQILISLKLTQYLIF